jgi:poly-gamma-glutamate synthesis protein (capsule biosynthesis protein)
MSFCGDARAVQGLVYGGVNVACMANNHSTNKGWGAYQSTQQLLTAYGIKPCGYDTVATTEIRGERFAFVAFNGVGQRFESEEIRRVIGIARQEADVVIASFHWGEEYVAFPSVAAGVAEDDPRQVARQAIDDGADLVIGNHPHWVQGIEIYHGHLITYAHGNFIFDQMWSMQTREGVVGRYVFYDRTLVAVSYWPLRIDDYGQPRWVDGPEAQSILNQMIESSRALAAIPAGAPPPAPTPTS